MTHRICKDWHSEEYIEATCPYCGEDDKHHGYDNEDDVIQCFNKKCKGQAKRQRTDDYYEHERNRRLDDELTNIIEKSNRDRLIRNGLLVRQGSQRDMGPNGQRRREPLWKRLRDKALKT
jgi:hypothetical protein